MLQRQHGGTLLWLAWDPDITVLDSSATIRVQRATTRGGHPGLPLGFHESPMAWGTLVFLPDKIVSGAR